MSCGINSTMKIILLAIIAFLLYQSPDARNGAADFLRGTADVVDTKPTPSYNPEYFQIPNPFHQ